MVEHQNIDQKLQDPRFQKTENSIITAFLLIKEKFNVKKLIKTAKVSRSTFYRHHCSAYEIVPSYEQYILRRYQTAIRRLVRTKKPQLNTLFQRTLIFLYANRHVMNFLLQYSSTNMIEKMLSYLGPALLDSGKITNQAMLDIYFKEISSLIEKWQQDGFKKDEIDLTISKILYLASTAHIRLGPIT